MEYSPREKLAEEACRLIEAGYRAVERGGRRALVDLVTTAQGYLQLFNDQPEEPSYETKLRQAIARLSEAMEKSA